jgi:hypothetical protein
MQRARISSGEDSGDCLKRVRRRTEGDHDVDEAVEQLPAIIIGVATPADREGRRRQAPGDYPNICEIRQATERLDANGRTDDICVREVPFEGGSMYGVRLDHGIHREPTLLEAQRKAASASEEIEHPRRSRHRPTRYRVIWTPPAACLCMIPAWSLIGI